MNIVEKEFQLIITVENIVDKSTNSTMNNTESNRTMLQEAQFSQLDEFISQRPFHSSSREYQIIKPQLEKLFRTNKVNLDFSLNDNNPNGKMLIIIRRFQIKYFVMPDQYKLQIILRNCNIDSIDYSVSQIAIFRNYCIDKVYTQGMQFMVKQMIFQSAIYLKKLYIYTRNTASIRIVNQPEKNFIDLSQFCNLKTVYIFNLSNNILLPETLNQLTLRKNQNLQFRILNNTLIAKFIYLSGFDLSNIKIIVSKCFYVENSKMQNYNIKQNIDFISTNLEIDTLIVEKNNNYLKLENCAVNKLKLNDYNLESIEIGSVNQIIVGGTSIFNYSYSHYDLDLSKFINLKSIKMSDIQICNIAFPEYVQSLCFSTSGNDTNKKIDLSHLKQLQNLCILSFVVEESTLQQIKLTYKVLDNYDRIRIQVNKIMNGIFTISDYLENIEIFSFGGVDHIYIQGQPDDTIDGTIFKSLRNLTADNSPNINIINHEQLRFDYLIITFSPLFHHYYISMNNYVSPIYLLIFQCIQNCSLIEFTSILQQDLKQQLTIAEPIKQHLDSIYRNQMIKSIFPHRQH